MILSCGLEQWFSTGAYRQFVLCVPPILFTFFYLFYVENEKILSEICKMKPFCVPFEIFLDGDSQNFLGKLVRFFITLGIKISRLSRLKVSLKGDVNFINH